MKRLLFSVCMLVIAQLSFAQQTGEYTCEGTNQGQMCAVSYFTLNAAGNGSTSVRVQNYPSGATLDWSITGSGRCYIYPNGSYASISVYAAGSYRVLCDVYVGGVRVDGITRYITVYPYGYGSYGKTDIETENTDHLLVKQIETANPE